MKSVLLTSLASTLGYVSYKNPSDQHYHHNSLHNHHRLSLVHRRVRSQSSQEYIDTVQRLKSLNLLGYCNFGLFSLVYERYNDSECREYGRVFLTPRWVEYVDRVVDIGFMGKWLRMEEAMIEYDVNDEEWT